jgi:transcriptional regulator with XRE-family HTH domain
MEDITQRKLGGVNVLTAPPLAVEQTLSAMGHNLRTARLRRNMTIQQMADKLGVHRTVVANMERGRPTTSIVVYVSMLWALNLSHHLEPVASPLLDTEGMALARSTERNRASEKRGGLDNDF